MELNQFTAISPIDGRYRKTVKTLARYFSEFALIRYRVLVEAEYFIALSELGLPELKPVPATVRRKLRKLYYEFKPFYVKQIKRIELTTNHDVKAVEYFLKDSLGHWKAGQSREFIHFGLTSQDINNTAVPLSFRDFMNERYFPEINALVKQLILLGQDWKSVPMLSHTHGQPASPTLLGKEVLVFADRLEKQIALLERLPIEGKFGGAVGNFNAHYAAYPGVDWIVFAETFLDSLGLKRQRYTTQIEQYDMLGAWLDGMKRINTILMDCCQDFWSYVSLGYFRQRIKDHEVGSSAMPHKVNPIDFENAEGNFGVANALFQHLSAKLPISRMQRDLTDSTVLRNLGVPCAHTILAVTSLRKGLGKLNIDRKALKADLDRNWIVVAEAVQTILRREGYKEPYEALKKLTRSNEAVGRAEMEKFIDSLKVSPEVKSELRAITPEKYTGKMN